jgi:hypothetical protein
MAGFYTDADGHVHGFILNSCGGSH